MKKSALRIFSLMASLAVVFSAGSMLASASTEGVVPVYYSYIGDVNGNRYYDPLAKSFSYTGTGSGTSTGESWLGKRTTPAGQEERWSNTWIDHSTNIRRLTIKNQPKYYSSGANIGALRRNDAYNTNFVSVGYYLYNTGKVTTNCTVESQHTYAVLRYVNLYGM